MEKIAQSISVSLVQHCKKIFDRGFEYITEIYYIYPLKVRYVKNFFERPLLQTRSLCLWGYDNF